MFYSPNFANFSLISGNNLLPARHEVSILTIGLQTDIGSLDIAVKVLQSAIIVGSLFVLELPKRLEDCG